jgi:phosphoglycolate phosphatase-like HAD superfamily hydrolase
VPTPTVVLFDIDGTLLTCGGAGRRAMERAFDDVLGRDDVGRFPYGGMTDRAIARAAMHNARGGGDDDGIDAILERYLAHLETTLPTTDGFAVLPGVLALLEALAPHAHLAVGLGTGNMERGAALKLDRAGLSERFSFGGFGSDHEERARVLRAGAERGASRLGVALGSSRVIVVGDTPRDIEAARAIGASVIAVATGGYGLDVLDDADVAVESLADPRTIARITG